MAVARPTGAPKHGAPDAARHAPARMPLMDERRRRSGGARVAGRLALTLLVACGDGTLVTLGQAGPDLVLRDGGRPVAELNGDSNDWGPTLTEDLLEIYFVSDRPEGPGQGDVYHALRGQRSEPFAPPSLVEEVSSEGAETAAAVSPDGLTLWVGTIREGGMGGSDIWRWTRPTLSEPWTEGGPVQELNSPLSEVPQAPVLDDRLLPYTVETEEGTLHTRLAWRASPADHFSRIELLEELRQDGKVIADGSLTQDGRVLFFSERPVGAESAEGDPGLAGTGAGAHLMMAWRHAVGEPFVGARPLEIVDGPGDERAPCISSDRSRFFFSTTRRSSRLLDIYATSVEALSPFD